jgi:hypothetical protein
MVHIDISETNKQRTDKVKADLLMRGKDATYDDAQTELLDLWEQVNAAKTLKVIPQ